MMVGCNSSPNLVNSGKYKFAVIHLPMAVAAVCLDNCAWISVQASCGVKPCKIGLNWNGITAGGDQSNYDLVIEVPVEGYGRFTYRCNQSTCEVATKTWSSSVKLAKLNKDETVEVDSGSLIDLTVLR